MNKLLLSPFILILCFIYLYPYQSCGQTKELQLDETGTKDYKFLFYKGYNGNMNLELPASELESFKVHSGAGNVSVKGYDSDVITVEASITVSATSAEKAVYVVKEFMDLSLEKEGSKAILTSHFDFHRRSNFKEAINPNGFFTAPVRKIDLVIFVPKNLKVTVDDRSGDLKIENIENDLHVVDRSGDLQIKNVNGNLRVNDTSGDLKLSNVNVHNSVGKMVRISDNSGTMRLDRVNGTVSISDNSGDININKVIGNVVLRDTSGDLYIGEINGDLKLSDASGDIRADDIMGNFTVHDNSGGIYVNYVAKNVHVGSAGSGSLNIRSYDGKISGDLKRLYR